MDREEIIQTINEGIQQGIATTMPGAIEKHVNGHIRELRAELQPVIDGVRFINTGRRFLIWIGIPVSALWVAVTRLFN
jgi:hypothetical protein